MLRWHIEAPQVEKDVVQFTFVVACSTVTLFCRLEKKSWSLHTIAFGFGFESLPIFSMIYRYAGNDFGFTNARYSTWSRHTKNITWIANQ